MEKPSSYPTWGTLDLIALAKNIWLQPIQAKSTPVDNFLTLPAFTKPLIITEKRSDPEVSNTVKGTAFLFLLFS